MFGNNDGCCPQHIDFLLLPGFSMIAAMGAIDSLRVANRVSERRLYSWRVVSPDGGDVRSSNSVAVRSDLAISDLRDCTTLFVCSGVGAREYRGEGLLAKLCALEASGAAMGGICTGALVLARAGLLRGYRCTIHWENAESFAEEFPDVELTSSVFEIDRDRFTCAGGTASVDMMLQAIARGHGETLAVQASEMLLSGAVREAGAHQRSPVRYRLRSPHPKLISAIEQMEAFVESPVPLERIAGAANLSSRQMERLFQQHLHVTPSRYYLELRLKRARNLLRHTSMSILQVAVATGFISASHFSRCYRECYAKAPRNDRADLQLHDGAA